MHVYCSDYVTVHMQCIEHTHVHTRTHMHTHTLVVKKLGASWPASAWFKNECAIVQTLQGVSYQLIQSVLKNGLMQLLQHDNIYMNFSFPVAFAFSLLKLRPVIFPYKCKICPVFL